MFFVILRILLSPVVLSSEANEESCQLNHEDMLMFVKPQLISEIERTENLTVIVQLFEILQLIKQNTER